MVAYDKYCSHCGENISSLAEICPKCGIRQTKKDDKWIVTLLLCLFLGTFGIHRFYTGHIVIGIFQLITLGGCGIWSLIDLILIVTNNYKDSNGIVIRSN